MTTFSLCLLVLASASKCSPEAREGRAGDRPLPTASDHTSAAAPSQDRRTWQDTEAGRHVIAYLSCVDFDCSEAVRRVTALGPEAVEPLSALLRDGPPLDLADRLAGDVPTMVRLKVASALGLLDDPRARRLLIGLIRDAHPLVRAEACTGLGRARGDASAFGALVATLDDSDPLVRENAVQALGSLGNRDALPALAAARKREVADHILGAIDAAVRSLQPR